MIAHPAGAAAERRALQFLQAAGLELVAQNWRSPFGEIDLIMWHGEYLVFVEVRQRRSARYGGAAASITPTKQRRISLSAAHYLQCCADMPPCRFDAVLLQGSGSPVWLQNIFDSMPHDDMSWR